jgi:hypothetical protein
VAALDARTKTWWCQEKKLMSFDGFFLSFFLFFDYFSLKSFFKVYTGA